MQVLAFLKSLLKIGGKTASLLTHQHGMKVVHALEPLGKSIFLAGPTPRSPDVPSWRPEAIEKLASLGFTGEVYCPESRDWGRHDSYDNQVWWELEALEKSTVVVFWIPRELATMPAFTTNVEFGYLVKSGKAILGAPEGAAKMSYLKMVAAKHNVPVYSDLDDVLKAAVYKAERGGRG